MKSRYTELGEELNRILEKRRSLCGTKENHGLCPEPGNEEEHERLSQRAAEIRKEMRIVRYGQDTD